MTFVKKMVGAALGALLLGSGPISSPTWAYVVTLEEVGNDVVATGKGALDLIGLNFVGASTDQSQIIPVIGEIITGPTDATSFTRYSGFTGPTKFGNDTEVFANSGSGDLVGILGGEDALKVPDRYVSGGPLSSTAAWLNKTFATLGVTPGTYAWTWGSGEPNQNLVLIIGAADPVPVPEPASIALLGTALAGLLLAGVIRRTRDSA